MKIVKSRPPDIRLKKHAEVKIHKKDFLPSMNQKKEVFSARKPDFSFQKSRKKDIPDRKQARREQTRTVYSQKAKKEGKRLSMPVAPETLQKKVTPMKFILGKTRRCIYVWRNHIFRGEYGPCTGYANR